MSRYLLVVLVSALLVSSVCEAQEPPATVWQAFLAWYKTSPREVTPETAFRAYADALKRDGVPQPEIEARMAGLQASAADRVQDLIAVHFDRLYANPDAPFQRSASNYLVRQVKAVKPGRALDVAMGQGRNALYLASLGWDVTGYDISEGGLASASAEATRRGWKLHAVHASHERFDFGLARWDLIVMTYSAAPMDDRQFLRRVVDSLKPGGIVVVEQFNASPDEPTNIGPPNALINSFAGLRVLHYEDVVDRSEWGNALCRIGRITAQK